MHIHNRNMCHLWPSSLLLIIEIFVLACMHEIFEENMFFCSLIIAHIYSDLHRAMEPGSTTPLWPVQTLIKAFARARSVISCHEQARPTPCRAPIMHGYATATGRRRPRRRRSIPFHAYTHGVVAEGLSLPLGSGHYYVQ